MSAAVPGSSHAPLGLPDDAPHAGSHGGHARHLRIAPLPTERREVSRPDLVAALRRQLALLSRHYAEDVARLQDDNDRLRAAEMHARVVAVRAEERAETSAHEARRWRRETARATAFAIREAGRRELLQQAMALPWWAIGRRRTLLDRANPFVR